MCEEIREDLRVIRTRKLLSKALFDLLEDKPFDKISVMDVCSRAMVHRATFYNHYESKEHLLEYALDELREELFASSIEKVKYSSEKEMYMSIIGKVIDLIDENREKILPILKQNSFEKVAEILVSATKRSLNYLISNNDYEANYVIPKNILIDFFIGGIANILINWLLAQAPCTKEELMKYLDVLINDKIYLK